MTHAAPTVDLAAIRAELAAITDLAKAAETSVGSLANQRFTTAWANLGRHVPVLADHVDYLNDVIKRKNSFAAIVVNSQLDLADIVRELVSLHDNPGGTFGSVARRNAAYERAREALKRVPPRAVGVTEDTGGAA